MSVAMRALDAVIETVKPDGMKRTIPIAEFHRLPGDTPHIETTLTQGELITAVTLPKPLGGKQIYRKVRDRASYAFALISVAAVVQRDGSGRVALGGVAHKPWRVEAAEAEMPQGREERRVAYCSPMPSQLPKTRSSCRSLSARSAQCLPKRGPKHEIRNGSNN